MQVKFELTLKFSVVDFQRVFYIIYIGLGPTDLDWPLCH